MAGPPAAAPQPGGETIRSAGFRRAREADWRALEALVTRVERKGLGSLSFNEARQLATLYRQTAHALSLARSISLDGNLLAYLEALTARAYLAVYAPQERLGGLLGRLIGRGIPQAVRRRWLPLALGFLTLILGALVGYLLFLDDPSWYQSFMPTQLAGDRTLNASTETLRQAIYSDRPPDGEQLTAFASILFSHNTRIALFVFALGVLLCVPSAALTFSNGLLLGAFVGLHLDRGLGWDIFGWLSVHGVTELSAIAVACGGGYVLGLAILFPGQRSRRDALREDGRDAVKLALLAAWMLLVAAILEGFFRQTVQQTELRLVIGWGVGLFWLLYLSLAGRRA